MCYRGSLGRSENTGYVCFENDSAIVDGISGEIYAYVFRENFPLSLAGAAAGLLMGTALHAYVMSCIKIDMISFDTRIAAASYIVSFFMTLIFAAAVNIAMFKKLDGINMAESLKSADG